MKSKWAHRVASPEHRKERKERLARMKLIDTSSQINNSPHMANLGIKNKDLKNNVSPSPFGVPSDDAKRKEEIDNEVKYPKFTIEDKHIEAAGLTGANPDEIFEFTVRARVEGVKKKSPTSREYYDSDRVELEIQDISDVKMIDASEPEERDEDKETASKIGFSPKSIRKSGSGPMSPKTAGVKL